MIEGATPERTINKLSYYKVKLEAEWMGNAKGSELTLIEPIAKTLLNRKTATLLETKDKALEGPPKDKMMKKTKKDLKIK